MPPPKSTRNGTLANSDTKAGKQQLLDKTFVKKVSFEFEDEKIMEKKGEMLGADVNK